MSRFWAADGSSSDATTSSDDSSASSEVSVTKKENQWTFSDDDSDSEDDVRVVKSAKDRAWESFRRNVTNIRNAMKINDWQKIQSEFEDLTKAMAKAKNLIANHGGVPRFFVRCLVDLEDFLSKSLANKAAFKKLSPGNGRALNRMKLILRKNNKEYAVVMDEYRKNPIVSSASEQESSESSSESSDSESESESESEKADSDSDSDDESDESDSDSSDADSDAESDSASSDQWDSSSESSSSSDSDAGEYAELKGRARWLKKNTVTKKKTVVSKEEKERNRLKKKEEREKEKLLQQDSSGPSKTIIPESNLTPSILDRKVNEIVSSRGKKGTDKHTVVRQLEALSRLAVRFGPRVEVPVLMHLITSQFDLQRTMDDFMEVDSWRVCARHLNRIASILGDRNKNWILGVLAGDEVTNEMILIAATSKGNMFSGDKSKLKAAAGGNLEGGAVDIIGKEQELINPHTGDVETADERAERVRIENEAKMTDLELQTIRVVGSLSSFMTRLDEEYIKSLQKISSHSVDYVIRLRDEGKLVELLARVQTYYERIGSYSEAAELAQLRIEHLYYRHDTIAEQVDKATNFYALHGESSMLHPACLGTEDIPVSNDFSKFHPGASSGKLNVTSPTYTNTSALITSLCTYVYKHGSDRSRTRAMLCHIFHNALHDRYLEARDLLLMSHLQDNISQANDVSTMILFNRMMATLGLAAFRLGRTWDAHQCLSDICSGRVRELLAQGVSTGRFSDKTPDQEKAEKRRQIPYHQHINLDLLEACHLISAMFLEVPHMANSNDSSSNYRKVISRTFRKNHEIYERQIFTGPPEQTRDHVMCATRALMKGDWRKCADLLVNLDVWQLVPGENASENIQKMLVEKIKLEGLRTYVLTYSKQYDSLSLSQLCNMFDLSKNTVHSVVSKMMINRELYASWDQPTETVVLRKVEPSQLQILALQFAEKAAGLVEANERLLDAKNGTYGYKDSDWKGRWGDGDRGQSSGQKYVQGGDRNYRSWHKGGGGRGGGRGGRGSGGKGRGRGRGRGRHASSSQNQSSHRW